MAGRTLAGWNLRVLTGGIILKGMASVAPESMAEACILFPRNGDNVR
jgi:hypothetical protein